MRPGIPWSVKGIDDDARQAAKLAARKAGMTLGEWLNSMIKESADEEAPDHQRLQAATRRGQSASRRTTVRQEQLSRPTRARNDDTDLARRLDSLAGQLSQITEHNQQTAVSRFLEPARAHPQDDLAIQNLIDRVTASEHASTQALGQLDARLDNISGKIDVTSPAMPQKPEDVPGFSALESAMRNIVDHIETSEASTRDTLMTVQQRMADMAARAAEATVAGQDHNAPAISSLEQRIGELTKRLEKSHGDTTREVQQYVQGQFNQLVERIDAVRHSTDAIAGQAQAAATQAAKIESQQLETRLRTIIGDLQGNQSQNPEVARIHGELESLNQRYDDIKSQSVSEYDITSLRTAVDQLVGKVSEAPVQQIEERMAELSRRLDKLDSSGISPQLTDLEQRVQAMDARLYEAISQPGDIGSATRLKDQISIVNERLASTEAKLSHLTTIEQAIEQLYKGLEENRDWARQTAEDAAQHMAQQITAANPVTGVSAGASPELQALENGLLAVKASADEADQRTQDTLEAVHDTLEQIINKLAQIEQQPPTEAASTQTAPLADLQNMAADMSGQQTDVIAGHPADQDPFAIDPIQPEPLMEQGIGEFETQFSVDDEHTFVASPPPAPEVGIAEPEVPASVNPEFSSQPPTSPSVEQSDAKPGLPGDEVREDFIAAARMAAQNAASQNSSILGGLNALTGRGTASNEDRAKPSKIGSLFSFPFRKKSDTSAAEEDHAGIAATQDAGEPETTSGRRRQLILAGLLLLAAVSAYTMGGVGKEIVLGRPWCWSK